MPENTTTDRPASGMCERRNPHTPHGECLGLAPEWPSEPVEEVKDEAVSR